MKLRLKNNSIRLRLTQSEVARFEETGKVEEAIEFGATGEDVFVYALAVSDAASINARFKDGKLTVFVPESEARAWASTSQIGLEHEQEIGQNKKLKILIEKDFACLDRRDGEDDADAFPHPREGKAC
jgi:hypothetical protein